SISESNTSWNRNFVTGTVNKINSRDIDVHPFNSHMDVIVQ
ncbi:689_t:CDS:1, partial [Gigaspora rosea]